MITQIEEKSKLNLEWTTTKLLTYNMELGGGIKLTYLTLIRSLRFIAFRANEMEPGDGLEPSMISGLQDQRSRRCANLANIY